MNDLDAREQRLLSGGRRALSPTAADQQRVLLALESALGPPPSAPAPSGVQRGIFRSLLLVSALGAAVLTGYGWGFRAGQRVRAVAAVSTPLAAPRGVVAAAPAFSAVSPPAQQSEQSAAPREPRALVGRRDTATLPAPSVAAATSVTAPVETAQGLDEEVRQLRRIERALREDNPRLALVIAEDLERTMPRGQLLLERRAASLMASCQLKADGVEQVAARFLMENPGSPYAARVREICGLDVVPQRTSAGAGTDEARKAGGE